MAEKSTFENELPKKSTVKWLRGLDENGNPVLIDISDHATVVGELEIKTDDILADAQVLDSGIYLCKSDTTSNIPDSASGLSLLIARKCFKNSAYMIYELYGLNTRYRGYCQKIDSAFTEWKSYF